MRMQDKVVIVTGAGHPRGIGRGIALAMAREGAHLVAADINGEWAEAIAEEIRAMGRRAIALRTDISKEDDTRAMAEAALAEFGRIDVMVNDAGVTRHHEIEDISVEEWDWVLSVNLRGTFLVTKAVVPTMKEQRGGRLIYISSMFAKLGAMPGRGSHYTASTAGVIGFTKTMARQLAPYGITANAVAPGYINTSLTREWETDEQAAERRKRLIPNIPLGRVGTPEDIAQAVLFFASDGAAYVTGETLDVNGGAHID